MSTEEIKALDRRATEVVWNQGNMAAADEFFAPDVLIHGAPPETPPGREGLKTVIAAYRAAFPDLHVTVEDRIVEGDKLVSRWTMQGTHKGELFGIPATGKQVTTTGMSISRVEDSKVVEVWSASDQLDLMQQIGAIPAPGG